jgi:hypothetical protein
VANRVPPVLRDPRARRASPDKQVLYATSKGPEMLSRAAMAKCLHRPFARKVLLRFKERPGPNVAQQPAWLGSACGNRPPSTQTISAAPRNGSRLHYPT